MRNTQTRMKCDDSFVEYRVRIPGNLHDVMKQIKAETNISMNCLFNECIETGIQKFLKKYKKEL